MQSLAHLYAKYNLPSLINVSFYVDTIGFITPARPANDFFFDLQWMAACFTSQKSKAGWKIRLHTPNTQEAHLKFKSPEFAINEAHLAIDFQTGTEEEAEVWTRWVNNHYIQKYHQGFLGQHEDTGYWSIDRWGKKNPTVYKRRSEITAEWCCHLEFRITSIRKLESEGIRNAGVLTQEWQEEFWRRKLIFQEVDRKELERRTGEKAKDFINNARRRSGDLLGREAQAVRDYMNVRKLRSDALFVMKPIDIAELMVLKNNKCQHNNYSPYETGEDSSERMAS